MLFYNRSKAVFFMINLATLAFTGSPAVVCNLRRRVFGQFEYAITTSGWYARGKMLREAAQHLLRVVQRSRKRST